MSHDPGGNAVELRASTAAGKDDNGEIREGSYPKVGAPVSPDTGATFQVSRETLVLLR